jgi:hypothetical protein
MEVRLGAARGGIEIEACLSDKVRKFHEIRRRKLETAVRKIDMHHASWAYGHGAEVFRTREDSLIVQIVLLRRLFFIIRFSTCLCNSKFLRISTEKGALVWYALNAAKVR